MEPSSTRERLKGMSDITELPNGTLMATLGCSAVTAQAVAVRSVAYMFHYRTDPHAIHLKAAVAPGTTIGGAFAFTLLYDALATPGRAFGGPPGLVRVVTPNGRNTTCIDVWSEGHARSVTVAFQTAALEKFVKLVKARVKDVGSVYTAGLDEELARLLEGNGK